MGFVMGLQNEHIWPCPWEVFVNYQAKWFGLFNFFDRFAVDLNINVVIWESMYSLIRPNYHKFVSNQQKKLIDIKQTRRISQDIFLCGHETCWPPRLDITSRCTGKEPALLPRSRVRLGEECRPDTRERLKSSLETTETSKCFKCELGMFRF